MPVVGSDNPFPSVLMVEGTTPATPASGRWRLFVDTADGLLKLVDDAGAVTAIGGSAAAHIADTSAAHAASAVSFTPTGTVAATDVQAAIAEVASEAAGGATPPDCYEAFLTSPVTIVNSATFYDGPSLSLPAGDWLVEVQADISSANASATGHTIQIYDGTTVYVARETWHTGGAGGGTSLSARARVHLTGTTTVKLRCASARGSSDSVILDTAAVSGTTDKCTSIVATAITPI